MENHSIDELNFLIALARGILKWLDDGDDPIFDDPAEAALIPRARAQYTQELAQLLERRNQLVANQSPEPVTVGLGTAKINATVKR